jgi:hypothetical protein
MRSLTVLCVALMAWNVLAQSSDFTILHLTDVSERVLLSPAGVSV